MSRHFLRCGCGLVLAVSTRHSGANISCRRCRRVLLVPSAMPAGDRVRNAALYVVQRARRHPVAALSWLWLAGTIVATALLWLFGDAWWPATVLLFSGRWVILVPLVVLVPAALLRAPRHLIPLAIGAIVATGPVMGFHTGWRRALSHPEGLKVRVVTFNTDNSARVTADLATLLDEWKADLVALQECGRGMAEGVRALPGWHAHVVRQQCFLSRWPILDSLVMDRSALEVVANNEQAAIGGAGDVVRYTVATPQGPIFVTNLHLETPRKGLEDLRSGVLDLVRLRGNTELRAIESRLARRWVDGGKGPTLVMGDFNTPIESRIFQASWGDFDDAFSLAGLGFGMTKRNGWISVRIDHVLTGPGWHVDRATVGKDVSSDHLPVIADLTLIPVGKM